MASYLDRIVEATRHRLGEARRQRSFNDLEREASSRGAARDFLGSLRAPGIRLVAEFKRRSPSRGPIGDHDDPAEVAKSYERGGAAAMSVLTEPAFFSGSLADLESAREACRLPVLRKDFLLDPYQVVEARAAGADAVLLIVGAIDDPGLRAELAAATAEIGMAALVEVHDEWELDGAFEIDAALIGVNQRDLTTFDIDPELAIRLRGRIPQDVAVVAESGISSRGEVASLEEAGVDAVLVGETLMRAPDPQRAVEDLLGREQPEG